MPRSLVTIDDLTNDEIEAIFELTDRFLETMGTPGKPHRIQGTCTLASEHILATLFHEPSTRTRLSFESAMNRLGGRIISSADGASTSAVKGETLADTARVLENYADIIVIRHPWEGAARVVSDYADVPVINAGDGSHEHPTQTLCDLYTLRTGQMGKRGSRKNKDLLKDLNVVLCGDLQHGRTVHSLVYALARFGSRIVPLPATHSCDFPEHVRRRLARDYNCYPLSKKDLPEGALPADLVYITPEEPHQRSLWHPDALDDNYHRLSKRERLALKQIKGVDAVYTTRLQRERGATVDAESGYPVIDSQFLNKKLYRNSQVMHPLPRVDELGYDVDEDPRGVYFKQAAYGVPVRMALIAALLEIEPTLAATRSASHRYPIYERRDGIWCHNTRCVTSQTSEKRYITPRFGIVDDSPTTIRCAFCDHEQEPKVAGSAADKVFSHDPADWKSIPASDLVLFLDEQDALAAGYQPAAHSAEAKSRITADRDL